MPDLWETRYGLNPLNAGDATADTDGFTVPISQLRSGDLFRLGLDVQ